MQTILHIPNIAVLPAPYVDEAGALTIQPAHIVGTEALVVVRNPAPDLLEHAVPIGRVVNANGEPAPSLTDQATYDRLYPRTPIVTEEGTFTPPALFGCLGTPEPEPPLDDLKARKKAEMQAALDAVLAPGYTCSNGITMNAYEYDARKLDDGSRLNARNGLTTLKVRDFHNARHDLPLADVDQMVNELGANYQTLLQRYWDCDDAIAAATTAEEVEAVVW